MEALLHAQMDYSRTGSSAALLTSIRHAAVAGQPPRFNHGQLPGKLQSVAFKGKLSPPLIKIYPLTRHSPLLQLRARCSAACHSFGETVRDRGTPPNERLSSPGASEASKAGMGRLLDQWRDDALHHVRQHGEGGHHDEVDEPWRHTGGMNFISIGNE